MVIIRVVVEVEAVEEEREVPVEDDRAWLVAEVPVDDDRRIDVELLDRGVDTGVPLKVATAGPVKKNGIDGSYSFR